MENTNAEVGHGQKGEPQSGLLSISLSANVVLAIVVVGLAIWGWERDKMVAAAIEERDEAWQTSRDLQNGLINAKGLINGMSDPFRQQPQTPDDDPATPP